MSSVSALLGLPGMWGVLEATTGAVVKLAEAILRILFPSPCAAWASGHASSVQGFRAHSQNAPRSLSPQVPREGLPPAVQQGLREAQGPHGLPVTLCLGES